jgi:hypothetical protein
MRPSFSSKLNPRLENRVCQRKTLESRTTLKDGA